MIFSACRPYFYRSLMATFSPRVRVTIILMSSFFPALLLNIPKYFESELVTFQLLDFEHNTTCEITTYQATQLRVDPGYVFYYVHWTRYNRITMYTGLGITALLCTLD